MPDPGVGGARSAPVLNQIPSCIFCHFLFFSRNNEWHFEFVHRQRRSSDPLHEATHSCSSCCADKTPHLTLPFLFSLLAIPLNHRSHAVQNVKGVCVPTTKHAIWTFPLLIIEMAGLILVYGYALANGPLTSPPLPPTHQSFPKPLPLIRTPFNR